MVSVLISGAWSNVYVFAQHSSLPWSPSAAIQQSSSSDDESNTPGWTTLTTAASKPLPIAPQLAINQEKEPQVLSNNGTGIQDHTSNSPVAAQDNLMYLGYHGISANNNDSPATKTSTSTLDRDHSSSSKDKYNPDRHYTKGTIRGSSIGHNKSPAQDSSSTSHNTSIGKATSSKSETNHKDIKPCTHNKSFPRESLEPKNPRYSDCNDHRSEDRFFWRDTFFNADTFSDNNFLNHNN
jgi:hypothetical protein